MSILALGSEEFAKEMNKRRCKGIIASYVARGKQPLETVLKTLNTHVRKDYITIEQLGSILSMVESKTVRPFRHSTRIARYNELRKGLGF